MYPELLTRPDLKTYLPPIGGLTGPSSTLKGESFASIRCSFFLTGLALDSVHLWRPGVRQRPVKEADTPDPRRMQRQRRLWL